MSDTPVTAVQTTAAQTSSEEAAPATQDVNAAGYEAAKADATGEARMIPVREREFRIAEQLPGIILLDLGLASDPNATQGEQLRAIRQFLHAAIHPDDVDQFEVYLRQAQPVIEMEELNGVVEKLITEVAGRPTE